MRRLLFRVAARALILVAMIALGYGLPPVAWSSPSSEEVGRVIASDGFSRSRSSGWGTAELGGTYTPYGGTRADYTVDGEAGAINLGAAGVRRGQTLSSVSERDIDATFTARLDRRPAKGMAWVGLAARFQDRRTHYLARVRLDPDGRVYLVTIRYRHDSEPVRLAPILRTQDVSGTEPSEVRAAGLTATADGSVRVRVQVMGIGPTLVRMKAWTDGEAEPPDWQYVTSDNEGVIYQSGAIGLHAFADARVANTPLVATFDDVQITVPVPDDGGGIWPLRSHPTQVYPGCRSRLSTSRQFGEIRVGFTKIGSGYRASYAADVLGATPNKSFALIQYHCSGTTTNSMVHVATIITDGQGDGQAEGSHMVGAGAKGLHYSLVPFCEGGVIPCGDLGYATDVIPVPGS